MRPMHALLVLWAGVSLAGVGAPSWVHAAAPTRSYSTTKVEVDASALEGGGSTMEKSLASLARNEVQKAIARELGQHVELVDQGAEVVVAVRLEWKDYETSHYGVSIDVRRGASVRGVVVDECKLCDEEKLAKKVAGKMAVVLPYLAEGDAAGTVEPDPVESEPDAGADPEPTAGDETVGNDAVDPAVEVSTEDDPRPRPLGALGIAGAVVGAGGLAGIIYGGVLMARGTTTTIDGGDGYVENYVVEESYARPGGIWLGVGVGTAVVGAAMIAVDLTVLRKRRESRVAVHPAAGPAFVGATVRIRF